MEEIKQFYVAPIQSASFLLERSLQSCMFLSTGFPELDESLNGGFRTGEMIEITGESGSGKSQVIKTSNFTAFLSNRLISLK